MLQKKINIFSFNDLKRYGHFLIAGCCFVFHKIVLGLRVEEVFAHSSPEKPVFSDVLINS